MMKKAAQSRIGRVLCIFFSVLLTVMGIVHISAGKWGWKNYWGGVIVAPFGVLIGLLLLYAAVFHWDRLQKSRTPDEFKGNWKR